MSARMMCIGGADSGTSGVMRLYNVHSDFGVTATAACEALEALGQTLHITITDERSWWPEYAPAIKCKPFAGLLRESSPWNHKHLHREICRDQKYRNKQMRDRRKR